MKVRRRQTNKANHKPELTFVNKQIYLHTLYTHFRSQLVESEGSAKGYAHGLILNFGSADPRIRIRFWADPNPDSWRALLRMHVVNIELIVLYIINIIII